MKALTLHQPWATLVAIGAKRIETRSWQTRYRGKLAIHAGKNVDFINMRSKDYICNKEPFYSILMNLSRESPWSFKWGILPFGAVIATCELLECRELDGNDGLDSDIGYGWKVGEQWYPVTDQEMAFANFEIHRFMWFLDNVQLLPAPIPAKGAMGLWEWSGG